MNGAESLVRTLLLNGVDTCFANPGTSEMHFVAALDRFPEMRCVLGLAEGVVTGAADGYGRMRDGPAATLLHCGPGLGNGIANLHNAMRANTPMINIVGDQATYHAPLEPALASDPAALAGPVSKSVRTVDQARFLGMAASEAIGSAMSGARGIASVILPSDASWSEGGVVGATASITPATRIEAGRVEAISRLLVNGRSTAIILGGNALRAGPSATAAGIATKSGAALFAPAANGRVERGRGRAVVDRLPYAIDAAVKVLAPFEQIVLVGAPRPVAFFAYPGKPARPERPGSEIHVLARPDENASEALSFLAQAMDAAPWHDLPNHRNDVQMASGPVLPGGVAQSLTALMPEHSIIIDESVSYGRGFFADMREAPPHDWLQLTGGAIGSGIPMALGAAIAAPSRRVINLQADGSGLFTLQGLWSQARERVDVTTVILANRRYAILQGEFTAVGIDAPGRNASDMLDLTRPAIDWVKLSEGFGVEAARADTMERFNTLLAASLRRRGPFLIELEI